MLRAKVWQCHLYTNNYFTSKKYQNSTKSKINQKPSSFPPTPLANFWKFNISTFVSNGKWRNLGPSPPCENFLILEHHSKSYKWDTWINCTTLETFLPTWLFNLRKRGCLRRIFVRNQNEISNLTNIIDRIRLVEKFAASQLSLWCSRCAHSVFLKFFQTMEGNKKMWWNCIFHFHFL